MAKILDRDVRPMTGKGNGYPWDEWLDGQPRLLERGVDFLSGPADLRTAAYRAAEKRGIRVRTQVAGENLEVQAIRP
ncbi:MAG: hypothetical protein M0030_03395 [Actinomycetota bacterium]|nr:hypothetical protein [Actinomycetota bacterium]